MSAPIDGCTILLASGRYVDPLNLRPDDILIRDVAHALSHQCRYTGHTRVFYSVAEHSVRLVDQLRVERYSREIQLWGLLHDAPEAYLVDLPRPLKRDPEFGAMYRAAEARAMQAVIARFELIPLEPAAVKHADLVMLATERRDLMPAGGDWSVLDGIRPHWDRIVPWSPEKARDAFLGKFGMLYDRQACA